jgi:hypothetical protein
MAKNKTAVVDPEPANNGQVPAPKKEAIAVPAGQEGLVAVGVILRRTRRIVGENGVVVVCYTLGPSGVMVEEWDPDDVRPIGARVVLPIEPAVYQGRVVLRISRQEVF